MANDGVDCARCSSQKTLLLTLVPFQQRQGPSSGERRRGPSIELSTLLARVSLRFYTQGKNGLAGWMTTLQLSTGPAALSRYGGGHLEKTNDRYGLALVRPLTRFGTGNLPALRRNQSAPSGLV